MLDFNVVYNQNKGAVIKRIKTLLCYKNEECLMEIVDDTFIKVNKHLKNFDESKGNIRTWIITIANNTFIDYYRNIQTDRKYKTSISDFVNSDGDEYFQIDSKTYSDGSLMYDENHKSICDCTNKVIDLIAELDKPYRDIAEMRFIDDLKYKDIAIKLNLPLNTVKINIHRIKEQFKQTNLKAAYI